jgi:hypothetical protein
LVDLCDYLEQKWSELRRGDGVSSKGWGYWKGEGEEEGIDLGGEGIPCPS